tara:strand:+ start:522 stop:986 length:465 start_codon:yes stop_codon:yes gene_type:complete
MNRVRVYRNLHLDCWSVKDFDSKSPRYNRVIEHPWEICLEEVTFIVSQAGREKVLKEKRKNVHAFVQGTQVLKVDLPSGSSPDIITKVVSYNPYEASQFIAEKEHCGASEIFVYKADFAHLKTEGDRAWVEAYWVDDVSFLNGTGEIAINSLTV